MNIDDLFVMEALEGLLIINPQNAEMIAVERENIKKAIDDIQFGRENSSLKDFYKQMEVTNYRQSEIESGNGIVLLPTFKCNFACKYCFEKNFKQDEMSIKMLPSIKEFINHWNQKMHCNYTIEKIGLMGGEVFRKDTVDLVDAIFKTFSAASFEITTNGAELMEYKEYIRKYRPRINLSLDGTEQMHLSRRHSKIDDAYQRILEGLSFLMDEEIETTIVSVFGVEFTAQNYMEFMNLLESYGWLKRGNLRVLINLESDMGIVGCNHEKQLVTIRKYMELLLADKRAKYIENTLIPGIGCLVDTLQCKRVNGVVDTYRCSANLCDGLVFAPDGYVYNCNVCVTNENKVGKFYPTIEIYDEVVKQFFDRNALTIEECARCKMALFCKGGCPVSAITEHGTVQAGFCGIWEDERILENINLFIDVGALFQMARKYVPL